MEDYNLISSLKIDLNDCQGKSPADIMGPYLPEKAIDHSWVPQPIADQILAFYKFASITDKEVWEQSLPEIIKGWINPGIVSKIDIYGWDSFSI